MFNLFADDIGARLTNVALATAVVGGVLLVLLVAAAAFTVRRVAARPILFSAIVAVVIATTLTLVGTTTYLTAISATGQPVHWQTDYQIWVCGNQLNLRDPANLSNQIGSASLHERNDSSIHLDGLPTNLPQDFSLGAFMHAVGGGLTDTALTVPLNDAEYFAPGGGTAPELIEPFIHTTASGKVASVATGQKCGDTTAALQVFDYWYNAADNTYHQRKLTDPANFAGAHAKDVPPGDCVIFEFSPPKDRTDKHCPSYANQEVQ